MAKKNYTRQSKAAQIRNGTYGLTPMERFMRWVLKTETCWLWTGRTKSHGYAAFRIDGKLWRAHRFSYTIHNGEIPAGKVICHRCDNPKCVNPEHLFLGTQGDNMRDMAEKGRKHRGNHNPARGAAHGRAKLTENHVAEIRHAHANGANQSQLARIYGVSHTAISDIVHGKNWKP